MGVVAVCIWFVREDIEVQQQVVFISMRSSPPRMQLLPGLAPKLHISLKSTIGTWSCIFAG